LGLTVSPIPGAGLGGLVLTVLGAGAVVANNVYDDLESVPFGLVFVRTLEKGKMLEPIREICKRRWVE